MTDTDTSSPILPDFVPEGQLAKELHCSRRTIQRDRDNGLAWARIAGRVYVSVSGAREYYGNRIIGLTKTTKRRGA